MALLNFTYKTSEALSVVDEAISYAIQATNNLLYTTDLNSPYRILVEAQVSVYNQFLERLAEAERELTLMFLEIMGIVPLASRSAKVTLRFDLINFSTQTIYFRKGFPVRATNGIIFLTDGILAIPSGAKTGFIGATAITEGAEGNLPPNTITQPLQVISTPFSVTNEQSATLGSDGESILAAQLRLSAMIRKSGLVTGDNYIQFITEQIPDSVVSVHSPIPNQVEVFVSRDDGTPLTLDQKRELNGLLQTYKMIGLESLTVRDLEIINVFVEVIGSVRIVSEAENIARNINQILRNYLKPSNNRQIDENTSGIIILNEVERQINKSQIDFIQTVRIGLSVDSAYGQNFVFNPINQRVKLGFLRVTLIKDLVTSVYDFTA